MKKSERLRHQKNEAVERMNALVTLAKSQNRDLSDDEKAEFESKKQLSESLSTQITEALAEEAKAENKVDEAKLRAEGTKAERLRISTIETRLTAAKLSSEVTTQLRTELIDGEVSVEEATTKIFEALAKKSASQPPTNGGHTAGITNDQGDKLRETMAATLLHRYEPVRYKGEAEKAREWMGFSLMEMGRECLKHKGQNLRGIGPSETAQLMLTTSDFPNILMDVANKTLRAGYENYPNTFQAFATRKTARDFKNINSVALGGGPPLVVVNEHGEIKEGVIKDSKETYALATYARIVAITRQTLINDDLSALTRIPELMGRKAAILEGDIVWAKITGNPNMADGNAIFSAAHANYDSTGAVITVDSVGTGSAAITKQTGPEGDTLNLMPKFLVTPVSLRLTAQKLLTPVTTILTVTGGTPAVNAVPGWVQALTPITEPRLDKASGTAWYLFADPSQIDTVEYAYLEGQEGMYFETKMGFEVDGVKFKARHDFGAQVVDYRGLYKSVGA